MDLVDKYLAALPDGPRAARIAEVERHLADTHFCWIGGFSEESPFYYRVQSPVTFIEFDHHAGVFLTNPEPAKFHVHTIVRTPNGNDYGFDLLRQHYKTSPHHRHRARPAASQCAPTITTIIIMATATITTATITMQRQHDKKGDRSPDICFC